MPMGLHPRRSVLFGLFVVFICSVSFAAQTTNTLPVSVMVMANCSLSSAALSFGSYDPIGANQISPLDGLATFQIACTKGANVIITLNNGVNSSNAVGATRAMTDGSGHYLSYELYSNPARNQIWSLTNPISFIPISSATLTETVYGRIPSGQNQAAGSYIDTVTISATF